MARKNSDPPPQAEFLDLFAPVPAKPPSKATEDSSAPRSEAAPQPAGSTRQVHTVSQVTTSIRRLLESQIGRVWVSGEVTNLRAQSSGHLYFTLKDAGAQISCVLFRGEAPATRQHVKDGQMLVLGGEITVYEPRGQYQLKVSSVELHGLGALQQAFEELKRRLLAEGLFAQERKRPIPRLAQRIGIVTSPTGAAFQDVLQVIQRRQPALEIVLAPSRVQGQGAAQEICEGIRALNQLHASGRRTLDLILITRGGGSLEDLWAFNEEAVARAVYASALPVISAVGHEIDVTISDWVADLRAATPTAAAEIITEGAFSSRQFIQRAGERLQFLAHQCLEREATRLDHVTHRLMRCSPTRWLETQSQRLDDLSNSLARAAQAWITLRESSCESIVRRLSGLKPSRVLQERRREWMELTRRLATAARAQMPTARSRYTLATQRLELLSPSHVLRRGYSITRDASTGEILRSRSQLTPGRRIVTRVSDGEAASQVENPGNNTPH